MAIKLPYEQTENRQFNKFQTSLASALMPFTSTPMSTPVLLENVELKASGPTVVKHGLNRTLIGWHVVRLKANAVIWESSADNNTVTLNTTADVTVSLVVF